jgi:hypothetical protein
MDDIEKEFSSVTSVKKGVVRYTAENAFAIVEKCKMLKKKILGIEELKINDKITEVQDYIDYSAKYYTQFSDIDYLKKYHIKKNSDLGHWAEATQFIKDRAHHGNYFEITYD